MTRYAATFRNTLWVIAMLIAIVGDWWDDDGQVWAIECNECHSGARADTWNRRNGVMHEVQ